MNTSTVIRFMVVAVLCLAADSLTIAQSGGSFTITKSVIAGGGGSASGGSFTVDGTIGQAAAGTISNGGTFSVAAVLSGNQLNGSWGSGNNVSGGGKWVMAKEGMSATGNIR